MQIHLDFKLQLCHMNRTSEAHRAALGETLIQFCGCIFWVCLATVLLGVRASTGDQRSSLSMQLVSILQTILKPVSPCRILPCSD